MSESFDEKCKRLHDILKNDKNLSSLFKMAVSDVQKLQRAVNRKPDASLSKPWDNVVGIGYGPYLERKLLHTLVQPEKVKDKSSLHLHLLDTMIRLKRETMRFGM